MASPKPPLPLPPLPTGPGEFALSADGKAWNLVCPATKPFCPAEAAAEATPDPGDS